jgi:hypothetical protein
MAEADDALVLEYALRPEDYGAGYARSLADLPFPERWTGAGWRPTLAYAAIVGLLGLPSGHSIPGVLLFPVLLVMVTMLGIRATPLHRLTARIYSTSAAKKSANQRLLGPHKLRFDGQGVTGFAMDGNDDWLRRWGPGLDVHTTRDHLFLSLERQIVIPVPLRDLTSEQRAQLRSTLERFAFQPGDELRSSLPALDAEHSAEGKFRFQASEDEVLEPYRSQLRPNLALPFFVIVNAALFYALPTAIGLIAFDGWTWLHVARPIVVFGGAGIFSFVFVREFRSEPRTTLLRNIGGRLGEQWVGLTSNGLWHRTNRFDDFLAWSDLKSLEVTPDLAVFRAESGYGVAVSRRGCDPATDFDGLVTGAQSLWRSVASATPLFEAPPQPARRIVTFPRKGGLISVAVVGNLVSLAGLLSANLLLICLPLAAYAGLFAVWAVRSRVLAGRTRANWARPPKAG